MRRLSYRSCCSLVAGLGLLIAARTAAASSPLSTYVVPTAVDLLPSDAAATRVVIHGAFFQLTMAGGTYGDPKCGVMYFECVAGQETMCRMQWGELRAAIAEAKNSCRGFGSLNTLSIASVRAEGSALGTPDKWDLGVGTIAGVSVGNKCPAAQALVCPLASAADGGATTDAAPAMDAPPATDAPAATDTPAEGATPTPDAAAPMDTAATETGMAVPEVGGTDVATTPEPDAATEHPVASSPDAGAGNDARTAPAAMSSGCALAGGSAGAPPLALVGLLALGLVAARSRRR
jgi:MYXO-CTERM domain-containing protein